jgi:hypothetical protein
MINITQVIDYIDDTQGRWFLTADINKAFNLKEVSDTAHVRVILKRLAEKGLIEKHHSTDGRWRKVETDCPEMDLVAANPGNEFNVVFPMGLERVIIPKGKSLYVIAGATGAGKSAFLFNFVMMNRWDHQDPPIHAFYSEFTADRLVGRLVHHPEYDRNNPGFKAFMRDDNFVDVMKPDAINVVDWLSINSEHYRIGDMMKGIYNKLTTGIAFVAIQKNPNVKDIKGHVYEKDTGTGAEFGKHYSSLYLAMDKFPNNRLKIVKCKEWRDEHFDPEGLEWRYKLAGGIKFLQVQEPDNLPAKPEVIEITPELELPF